MKDVSEDYLFFSFSVTLTLPLGAELDRSSCRSTCFCIDGRAHDFGAFAELICFVLTVDRGGHTDTGVPLPDRKLPLLLKRFFG